MEKARILVVDDQAAYIEAVGALLAANGYEVRTALSGEQALERCLQCVPHLVLLDMRMPHMDGFEVCARLQENARTRDVPVIFLTAAHERDTLVETFHHGAVDYLTKPFVAEELLARVKTHVELKAARDHLERIAQERADLTQIVAHDLKNPLSGILVAADLLERGVQDPATLLDDIRRSVGSCLSFIDTYLAKSALSSDQRRLEISALSLAPIVEEAARGLQLLADSRGMCFRSDIVDDPIVLGNAAAVRHVLDNLLSNALHYAPEGSEVEVRVVLGRSGMGRVSVSDRGPGVPPERQQQLFRRYARIEGNQEVAHSSGLGLAISREEIGRMGGHLWYEDRAGGGAVFSFVLPLAPP